MNEDTIMIGKQDRKRTRRKKDLDAESRGVVLVLVQVLEHAQDHVR